MRLIDADALAMHLADWQLSSGEEERDVIEEAIRAIDNAPTIDATPIRHGRWVTTYRYGFPIWECSECGTQTGTANFPYCYNCGARMDEDTEY